MHGNRKKMSFDNLEEPQGNFGKFYDQGQTSVDKWFNNLRKLKRFILGHNRRPSHQSLDQDEKELATWERIQLSNLKKGVRKGVMMHDDVFKAWVEFLRS